jgi:hypothetical protein
LPIEEHRNAARPPRRSEDDKDLGGHRLVDAGRTPNGLYRMLVCVRCGGKILARLIASDGHQTDKAYL